VGQSLQEALCSSECSPAEIPVADTQKVAMEKRLLDKLVILTYPSVSVMLEKRSPSGQYSSMTNVQSRSSTISSMEAISRCADAAQGI